jgi:HAD superfamily hydrolase (TIGR01509 family)
MLQNHGLQMDREQFAATIGRTNADIFAQLYPELDPKDYAGLAEEKESLFREIITGAFPEMDGAGELVAALYAAGAALAVGSSGPLENVQAVLQSFSQGRLFQAGTCSKDIVRGKPDPEVFLKAAQRIGLAASRCAVVEDAPAGVQAGKAAGCAVIAITGSVPREDLFKADKIVDSLRELTPRIVQDLIAVD